MKKISANISILVLSATCLAGALLATGCGDHTPKLTTAESKAFDTAPPDVKQLWEKALAADKANDYVTAQASFDSLKKMILSDPQRKALETESTSFGLRLMDAVNKNDPAAVQAVQEINKSHDRRR